MEILVPQGAEGGFSERSLLHQQGVVKFVGKAFEHADLGVGSNPGSTRAAW